MRTKEEITSDRRFESMTNDTELIFEVLIDLREQNNTIIEWLKTINDNIIIFNNNFMDEIS